MGILDTSYKKMSTGTSSQPSPKPQQLKDKNYDELVQELSPKIKKGVAIYPQPPANFSRTKEVIETKKKELNVLQTADLWNTRIGLAFGSSMARMIGGSIKGVGVMGKDIAKGYVKDVAKDVTKGNFKDVYHEIVQGISKALSGITRATVVGKDFVKGAVTGSTIDEEMNSDSAFDKGAKYLADALSAYAEVQKNKQVTPSEIYDQLKDDTLLDKGFNALGDFFSNVGKDMDAVVSAKKTKYGLDPNPTLTDNILQGIGGLPLFIAGGAGLKALGTTIGFGEAGAGAFASAGNMITEAGIEANDVYEQELEKGKSKDEAITAGLNTYAGNLAIIGLSNKVDGLFSSSNYQGWRRALSIGLTTGGETTQEGWQQMVSNANTDKPIMEGVKDSFIVGLIVGAPAATVFGVNPKTKTPIKNNEDFVPTEKEIIENPNLSQDQKNTLVALTNGELTEQDKVEILSEAVASDSLVKGKFEYETGTPEYEALVTDVSDILSQGVNPVDVMNDLQNVTTKEGAPITQEYSQTLIADALARLESTTQKTQESVEGVQDTVNKIETEQQKNTKAEAYIRQKLNENEVESDVIEKVAPLLTVAVTGRGTEQQKQEVIDLLADPVNESSRTLYAEETGVELPANEEESRVILKREITKSKTRRAAEQMVDFELANSEAGYKVFLPPDATRREESVYGVPSTFPDWVPSELRSKELFAKVSPTIDTGKRPKEGKRAYKQAMLYDLIQDRIKTVEAELENSAYDIADPNENIDPNIAFQAANAQIQSESLITNQEAEVDTRQYFSAEEIPVAFVDNIRTPRGLEAWGKYAQGVITFVNNPRSDTPSHETVHAFLDIFVPEKLRQKYLDSAYKERVTKLGQERVDIEIANLAKRYNDKLSDERVRAIYAEEALADGFIEYVKGRNQKTRLQKFFNEVIAFLKSIGGVADSQRLYEDIIAKKRSRKAAQERELREMKKSIEDETFSVKNRIHEDDQAVMDVYIRSARNNAEISKEDLLRAHALMEKWNINQQKNSKLIANDFEKILDDKKKVTGTILYSEKDTAEYMMSHRPTEGLQVNDLEREGGDIEMPKGFVDELESYFSSYGEYGVATTESIKAVRKMKGKPDTATVTIYRASPSDSITAGDWITLSKKYATLHAESSGDENVKVHSYKVPASAVHFAGDDINEFGYFPVVDSVKESKTPFEVLYSEKEPATFVRSKTFSVQSFKNLVTKVPEFEKARSNNSETHAYTLGKETVKIDSAKLQKIEGKVNGMNTESYAVLVDDQVVFISEKIEDSAKWLADNAGKSVSIEQNATSTVFTDGNEAYVIVTSKDLVPLEIGAIQGVANVDTIKFYDTTGNLIETKTLTDKDLLQPTVPRDTTPVNKLPTDSPYYFAIVSGRLVQVKNDGVNKVYGEGYKTGYKKGESNKFYEIQSKNKAKKERKTKIEKVRSLYKKVKQATQTGAYLPIDYQNRLMELFADFDMTKMNEKTQKRLGDMALYFAQQEGEVPQNVAKKLERLSKFAIGEMTDNQLEEFVAEVTHIFEQGVLKKKLIDRKEGRLFAAEVQELADGTNSTNRGAVNLATYDPARFSDMLDGGKGTYDGAHYQSVMNPLRVVIDEAELTGNALIADSLEEIATYGDSFTEEETARIMYTSAIEQGAESQAEALKSHYKDFDFEKPLTEKEQATLDTMVETFKDIRPLVAAAYEAQNNRPFPDNARYFPFSYDKDIEKFDISEQDFFDFVPTKTSRGFTMERVQKVNRVLDIDVFKTFTNQVSKQLYYAHVQPTLSHSVELINSKPVQSQLSTAEQSYYKNFFADVATRGFSAKTEAGKAIASGASQIRANLNTAILGYKLSTVMIQPTAIFDSAANINKRFGTVAAIKMLPEFLNVTFNRHALDRVKQMSKTLQNREGGQIEMKELRDAQKGTFSPSPWRRAYQTWQKYAYAGIKFMDIRTASAAFERARKEFVKSGMSEDQAIAAAEQLMSLGQSSSNVVNRPQFLNSEAAKWALPFQSFVINAFNNVRYDLISSEIKEHGKVVGGLRAVNNMQFIAYAVGMEMLLRQFARSLWGYEDDEEKSWLDKFFTSFISRLPAINYIMSYDGEFSGKVDIQHPSLDAIEATLNLLNKAVDEEKDIDQKDIYKFAKNVLMIAGLGGTQQLNQILTAPDILGMGGLDLGLGYDDRTNAEKRSEKVQSFLEKNQEPTKEDITELAKDIYDEYEKKGVSYQTEKNNEIIAEIAYAKEYGSEDEFLNVNLNKKTNAEVKAYIARNSDNIKLSEYRKTISLLGEKNRVLSDDLYKELQYIALATPEEKTKIAQLAEAETDDERIEVIGADNDFALKAYKRYKLIDKTFYESLDK